LDGNAVWMYIRDLSGKKHKIKYKAVSVDPWRRYQINEGVPHISGHPAI
jgi:hypothetical protein